MKLYEQNPGLGMAAMQQFRIEPGKTALVIVDMQLASTHRDYGFQRLMARLGLVDDLAYFLSRVDQVVIPNIRRLQPLFRELRWPLIFLTIGSESEDYGDFDRRRRARIAYWQTMRLPVAYVRVGDEGHRIRPELAPVPGDRVINKTTTSAFNSSLFSKHLSNLDVTTLVFTGVATNFCVEMTMRDASDRGFLCFAVDDACASMREEMHLRALEILQFYGRVVSTDDLIAEVRSVTGSVKTGA